MPPALILLAIIALTLHILFTYLIPPPLTPATRAVVAALIIVVVLVFWLYVPGFRGTH